MSYPRLYSTKPSDSKSESDTDVDMKLRQSTFVISSETSVTIDNVDHTSIPRPNLQHDSSRKPIFGAKTQEEDSQIPNTDFDHTQSIEATQSIENLHSTQTRIKEPTTPTAAIETPVPESPATFFCRFFEPKTETTSAPSEQLHLSSRI